MPVPIAVAALVRDGRVLMVHRRPERRWYSDCWDLVGGHVEEGESAEQAVRRECQEEVGVRIGDPRPVEMAFSNADIEVHAFLVTRWDGTPVNVAPEEHDDLQWFDTEQLSRIELADRSSLPDIVAMIRSVG